MKRVLVALAVCSMLSGGSFAALILQDRYLDVPLPYSLPLAFASMLLLAPVFLVCFEKLRARRPIRIEHLPAPRVRERHVQAPEAPKPEAPAPMAQPRRAPVQGVVLLDFSSARPRREQAA